MTVRLFMRENNCYESDDHNRTYYGGDRAVILRQLYLPHLAQHCRFVV